MVRSTSAVGCGYAHAHAARDEPQRGVPRPLCAACDVGAVEFELPLFANGYE
jgi:hypothetical protein